MGSKTPVSWINELCVKRPPKFEDRNEGLTTTGHDPTFRVSCELTYEGQHRIEIGEGKTKKAAKQDSALKMMEYFGITPPALKSSSSSSVTSSSSQHSQSVSSVTSYSSSKPSTPSSPENLKENEDSPDRAKKDKNICDNKSYAVPLRLSTENDNFNKNLKSTLVKLVEETSLTGNQLTPLSQDIKVKLKEYETVDEFMTNINVDPSKIDPLILQKMNECIFHLKLEPVAWVDERSEGPSNNPTFYVNCKLIYEGNDMITSGEGKKLKDARKLAAFHMVKRLEGIINRTEAEEPMAIDDEEYIQEDYPELDFLQIKENDSFKEIIESADKYLPAPIIYCDKLLEECDILGENSLHIIKHIKGSTIKNLIEHIQKNRIKIGFDFQFKNPIQTIKNLCREEKFELIERSYKNFKDERIFRVLEINYDNTKTFEDDVSILAFLGVGIDEMLAQEQAANEALRFIFLSKIT